MSELKPLTAKIVGSFVQHNRVGQTELANLIASTYAALKSAAESCSVEAAAAKPIEKPSAHMIRKSIQPEYLVSFIDGKRYKSLKRHLTAHGMTFAEYREKYGLPKDYPSVSPNYSAARSEIAKRIRLGQGGRGGARGAAAVAGAAAEPVAVKTPAKAKAPSAVQAALEPQASPVEAPERLRWPRPPRGGRRLPHRSPDHGSAEPCYSSGRSLRPTVLVLGVSLNAGFRR